MNRKRHLSLLSFLFVLALSLVAQAQSSIPRMDYTVGITDSAKHLFHIKIQVTNLNGSSLDISLPTWTPGWYTIRPYASNVIKLHAHLDGKRLPMRAIEKQSWRIDTHKKRAITIEYDYFADNLNVNGADLTEKGGYFVGTSMFFYIPGYTTNSPGTIKFDLPDNWRVATGFKPATEKNTYLIKNFDNLVDCPTVMGDFDDITTSVSEKPIHIVIFPKGQYDADKQEKLKSYVTKVIESQSKMFGGLPYDDYWVLYVTGNLKGGGALEHENSTNVMMRAMPENPLHAVGVVSHEHFHAWNVKRIKPAGLIPYDYSKEQYTRELWFAEGFTNYYGDLNMRRAGVESSDDYLKSLENKIKRLQNSEPRNWVSLTDASITTWLNYGGIGSGFTSFTVNYYNKGEIVAFLLDMEIRGATNNQKSLDDVMRNLFDNFYKKNKGYTVEDVEKVASSISGKSFKNYFDKYIKGTDELDYNAALKFAGLELKDGKITPLENITDDQRKVKASWLGESIEN